VAEDVWLPAYIKSCFSKACHSFHQEGLALRFQDSNRNLSVVSEHTFQTQTVFEHGKFFMSAKVYAFMFPFIYRNLVLMLRK
jgi:hypothetical protein